MKTLRKFDLEIDGENDERKPQKIEWLLKLAKTAIDIQDWDSAHELLHRASACAQGKLELANLYLNPAAEIGIPFPERKKVGCKLLWELVNVDGEFATAACLALVPLYQHTKPLTGIALRLKADRLRKLRDPQIVQQVLKRIQRLPISTVENDTYGAYLLACELECYDNTNIQITQYLYQVAADAEKCPVFGVAALRLAEYLEQDKPAIAQKYYYLAKKNGFPAILARN